MSVDPVAVQEALARHLATSGLAAFNPGGAYPTTPQGKPAVFLGRLPDKPDLAVAVNAYGVDVDIDTQATNPLVLVQLRFRAGGLDPRPVQALAHAVFRHLHLTSGDWPGDVRTAQVWRHISAPIEADSNGRWEKADSYSIRLNP